MPEINRIRIANVSWEHRIINDELYDCYDGQNILLNLANGGGKSVLVQMMLQPIRPTCRLHGRPVDDYLSTSVSPTYLLLEWKLDNTPRPKYLLTGIAMCAIGQTGESARRTKYFTFTNTYIEANPYDIKHFPFIRHEENSVRYTAYDKAFEELKQAKGDAFALRCFPFDESAAYRAELREYGILPEEWALLAEINDKEGGLDELFSSCKTSDSLMNRWILPAVSEELGQGGTDLIDMTLSVMQSILSKEDILREKELLDDFLEKAGTLRRELSELCDAMDAEEKQAGELSGLYAWLSAQKETAERVLARCRAQKEEREETLRRIDREERSEIVLRRRADRRAKEAGAARAKEALSAAEAEKEETETAEKCMSAARFAAEKRKAEQTIASLNQQITALLAGQTDETFRRVAFTLGKRYESFLAQAEADLARLEQALSSGSQALREKEEHQNELKKEIGRETREAGAVGERVEIFRKAEGGLLAQLSLDLRRSLTGELVPAEIEAAKEDLQKRADGFAAAKKRLEEADAANRAETDELAKERETAGQERETAAVAVEKRKQEYETFEQAEKAQKERLERNGIEAARLYDRDFCVSFFQQLRDQIDADQEEHRRRTDALVKTRTDCQNGTLHTDRRFGEWLKRAGIAFETGESYLQQRPDEERNACLKKNPLLPFSFVVSRQDLKRLPSPESGETTDRVCPVVTYDEIAAPCAVSEKCAVLSPDLRLLCLYDENGLQKASLEAYQSRLDEQIQRLKEESRALAVRRAAAEDDLRAALDFPYQKESRAGLFAAQEAAEQAYRDIGQKIETLEKKERENREASLRLNESRHQIEQKQKSAAEAIARFTAFLAQNEAFEVDFRRQAELADALRTRQNELDALEAGIRSLSDQLRDEKQREEEERRKQTLFRQKKEALEETTAAEPLDWPLEELEKQHAAFLERRGATERELRGQKEEAAKAKAQAEETLARQYAELPAASYESLAFSEKALAEASEKAKKAARAYTSAVKISAAADAEEQTAADRLQDGAKELKKAGLDEPLAPETIFGDYSRRREKARAELAGLDAETADNQKKRASLESRANAVERYISPVAFKPAPSPRKGTWEELDVRLLGEALKKRRDENQEKRRLFQTGLHDVKLAFAGKNEVIERFIGIISSEKTPETYGTGYFLYEHLDEQFKMVEQWRNARTLALSQMEKEKGRLVWNALEHGRALYDELKKMSDASRVPLWQGMGRRQTLKIGVPDTLDKDKAKTRMTAYVENGIGTLRAEKKKGKLDDALLRRKIETYFSDQQLLEQVIGQPDIPIFLIKVDRRPENSGLRRWEKILVENSGGEFFVSCFVLISALMSYKRDSLMNKNGVQETTRVFLIDNPFGKTSSAHLLEAMLRIAERYHTQLICLSDLNQSSITNRFAVIYQLAVRQALYSRNSYLQTEQVQVNRDVRPNELLEHAVLATPPDQMSFYQEK